MPEMHRESPESTGNYRCPFCSNDTIFTGIDHNGFDPNECECDAEGGEGCECKTALKQDFTVLSRDGKGDAKINYEIDDGGHGSMIDAYTEIQCRECGKTIWKEDATPTDHHPATAPSDANPGAQPVLQALPEQAGDAAGPRGDGHPGVG